MTAHCDTSAMKVADNDKRLLNLLKVGKLTGRVKGNSRCSKINTQIKNNLQRLTINKDKTTMVTDREVTYERESLMVATLKYYLKIAIYMLVMLYVLIFIYITITYTVEVVLPSGQSNEQLKPAFIKMDLTKIVATKVKDNAICKMKLAHPAHSDVGDSRSHGTSQEPEEHSTPMVSGYPPMHSDIQHKVKKTPKFCRHSLPHSNTQHKATTPTFSGHPLAHSDMQHKVTMAPKCPGQSSMHSNTQHKVTTPLFFEHPLAYSGTQRKVKMISKFCGHPLLHSNTQRKVTTPTFFGHPLAHSDTERKAVTPESMVEITVSVVNETTAPGHNNSKPATPHDPRVRRDLDSQTIFGWIGSEISDGKVFRDFFGALHDSYETVKEKLSDLKEQILTDERNELQDESDTGKRVPRSAELPVRNGRYSEPIQNGRYSEPVGGDFNDLVRFYPQPQGAVESHSKDVVDHEQTAAASPVITFQVAPPQKTTVIMLVMNMFLPNDVNKNNYPIFLNIGQKQPTVAEAKTSTEDQADEQSERKEIKVLRNEQPVRDSDSKTTLPNWATKDRKVKEGRDANMGNKKGLLGDQLDNDWHYHMATTTTWSPEENRQVNMFDKEVYLEYTKMRTTEDWFVNEERESSRFVSPVVTPMTNIDVIIRNNIDETPVPKKEKATTPKAPEEHTENDLSDIDVLDIDLLDTMDTMLLVSDGNRQRLLTDSFSPLKRNTRMVESPSLRFSDDLTKNGMKRYKLHGKSVEKEEHKRAVRSAGRAENGPKNDALHRKTAKAGHKWVVRSVGRTKNGMKIDGPHGKTVKKAGHKWVVLPVGRTENGIRNDGPHGKTVRAGHKWVVRSVGRTENGMKTDGPHRKSVEKAGHKGEAKNETKSDGPHGKSIKMAGYKGVVRTAGGAENDVKVRRVFETAVGRKYLPAVPEKLATDVGEPGAIFKAEKPRGDGKVTRQVRDFPKYP